MSSPTILCRTALLSLALALPALAQSPGAKGTTLPMKTERTLTFTTSAGTWMSVDVSSDGRTIAFDLLGDIYTLPTTGGKATRISDGPGVDGQPRFSPDGKSIL